ncbi:transposase, Mutator family protein, partial [Yersinia pestis PY-19]
MISSLQQRRQANYGR